MPMDRAREAPSSYERQKGHSKTERLRYVLAL